MTKILIIRKCLSCEQSPAVITGLCNPCYYRFRYIKVAIRRKSTRSRLYCPKCHLKLYTGPIVREKSPNSKGLRNRQSYVCKTCGYSILHAP